MDVLKIDGAFVRGMESDPQLARLVTVILELGRALGLDVVAECVETAEQEQLLRSMGCSNAQGWLYSKAIPGAEAGELLGARAPALAAAEAPRRRGRRLGVRARGPVAGASAPLRPDRGGLLPPTLRS